MAEQDDLSDLGARVSSSPTPDASRSMANASTDLSDIGTKVGTAPPKGPAWKNQPVDVKQVELSDLGERQAPPKSYTAENGTIQFSFDRPYDGLMQAIQDNVLDPADAQRLMTHRDAFMEAQVRHQDIVRAAGSAQVAKAIVHGAGVGGAFILSSIPGAKVGGAAGVAVVGGPEDPLAAITGPIGAGLGALTTGTLGAFAARRGMNKLADYNDAVKSLVASAELHPVADAAGELVAFAASAPKSVANLVRLATVAREAGESVPRVVGAQIAKGAGAGLAFEGVLRPSFDAGRYLVADQLGMEHEKWSPPSVSSLAQNVMLGILTAGHSLEFKDRNTAEMANIVMRAKAREAAGIPFDATDPAAVIRGFESLGADHRANYQKHGLLDPLTPDEIAVYAKLKDQISALQETGALEDSQISDLRSTQARAAGIGRNKAPLTSAVVGLKPKGGANAPTEPSPMAQTPPEEAGGVPAIPAGQAGPVSQPAGAGQAQAPSRPAPTIPIDVAKEIGFTFNPASQSGGMLFEGLTPEQIAQMPKTWEFTNRDPKSPMAGATFYVPEGSSREDILKRFEQVRQEWMPPTEAQSAAGNYPKQHIKVHGFDISIETPQGAVRSGKDKGGNPWSVEMPADYGYIRGTQGKDKDHLDVYVGPNHAATGVFVVDQVDPDSKKFDEHKIMLGFPDEKSALMAYTMAFSDGRGIERIGAVRGMTAEEFKQWVKQGDTKSPIAKQKLAPVPEAPATIEAQVQMLKEGKRNAVLITPGEKVPESAKSYPKTNTSMGVVVFNPHELNIQLIQEAVENNTIGELLGYGIPAKPAPGTEVGAVVVRDKQGVEKHGVLTDDANLPAVSQAAVKVASPGDTIALEPEKKVIKSRGSSIRRKAAPAAPQEKQWKPIGANTRGLTVFADENGVRSYVENGVRVTEAVEMIPTREGVKIGVKEHVGDYQVLSEATAGKERKHPDPTWKVVVAQDGTTTINGKTPAELRAENYSQIEDFGQVIPPGEYTFAEAQQQDIQIRAGNAMAAAKEMEDTRGKTAPLDLTGAKNPYEFKPGDMVIDAYTATLYEVVANDVKGMAKLRNVKTEAIEDWNAYNNPRFLPATGAANVDHVFAGEVIHLKTWVDEEGKTRPATDLNGVATIPVNVKNGERSLGLDVDVTAEHIADLADGRVVWRDDGGLFYIFDPRTATLTRSVDDPAPVDKPGQPQIEEKVDGTSTRQTVEPRPGTPGDRVAGEAGSPPAIESVEAASRSSGGADVGIPPAATGQEPAGDGHGTGRDDAGQVRGAAEPGSGPGQPASVNDPIPAPAEPVPLPTPKSAPERPATLDPNAENHVIKPDDIIAPAGQVTKLKANVNAVLLLNRLEEQNRNATPEEKGQLAQYTGWGGLSQVFDEKKGDAMTNEAYYGRDDAWEKKWGKYYTQLKDLLTPDDWDAAARSSQYAHYTSRTVIEAMWQMAQQLGFVGGSVLEPAMGVGHFFGLAPEAIRNSSRFVGVEKDSLSGRISAKLYPQAKVFVKGFEEVALPASSVDLVITNVPFSDRIVADKRYPKLNLHNYFIAKAIDAVKPGGLVITISSAHTMDSQAVMRQYLAGKAELMAAVRLPNTAFKENAGTEVTTDILILRKPMTPAPSAGQPWAGLKETQTYNGKPLSVNEYFVDHPAMIMGRLSLEGTMHAGREEMAVLPAEGVTLADMLKSAVEAMPLNVFERTPSQMVNFGEMGLAEGIKDNSLVVRDGALTVARGGQFVDPVTVSEKFKTPAAIQQGIAYVGLLDNYRKLIAAQISPETSDDTLDGMRKELSKKYDAYAKKYGFLNERWSDFLDFEQGYYLVLGLEREVISKNDKGKIVKTYGKSDVFTKRTQFPRVPPSSAANGADALQISLSYQGRVDPEFIARLIGLEPEKAEEELLKGGLAFRNPENGLLETPERYLSGNVRKKLARARDAAESDPQYAPNIAALEKAQPKEIPFRQIRVRVGATWVQPEIMLEFAKNLFNSTRGGIQYVSEVDKWIVGGFSQTPQVKQTYGTERFDGEELLTYALNMKSPVVYDTIGYGEEQRRVFNEKETTKARVVIEKIQAAFQNWLRNRQDVQKLLEQRYNEEKNHSVETNWDIDRLDLPGASDEVILRANQRRAVFRGIQEEHGLLAHTMGSGKTFEQIAIAMEWKRLGKHKKTMIVVKNSTLGQFALAARKLYPGGNFLVATKDDLVREKRKAFLSRIAANDFDSIIIPQSQFDMLEDDPDFEKQMIKSMLDELETAIRSAKSTAGDDKRDPTVKELEKQKEKFESRLQELGKRKKEDLITFQQLGIDGLIVDEADAYKKPPFVTKLDRVAGLERQTSQRAYSLFLKARYIQSRNNGRGVMLATGTPITNTLGESWHMLNLASPHVLREYGVDTFDRFVSTFAMVAQHFDVNATGKLVLKNKLANFVNGPELIRMIRESWDIINQDQIRRILEAQGESYPRLVGGRAQSVPVKKTKAVKEFNDFLLGIYEKFKQLDGQEKKTYSYVPVLTFLAGKAAALDIRMVKRTASDDPGSKINIAIGEIVKRWKAGADDRRTQAIFLDSFNPMKMDSLIAFAAGQKIEVATEKESDAPIEVVPDEELFLFKDLKRKLMLAGVPENEILIVNEYDVNKPEASLIFDKVNSGEIRVVMGSTAKMGIGVNIQKRLKTVHHLDTPWFPAHLEQRNGRIERPGNTNAEVEVLYYGMEGTIDAGLYAKNEAKAKFAHQVLSGSSNAREFEDPVGPMISTLQEQMASLSGDPLLVEKVQLESRIRTLTLEMEAFEDDQARKADDGVRLKSRLQHLSESQAANTALLAYIAPQITDKPLTATVAGRNYTERKDIVEAIQAVVRTHEARIKRRAGEKFYNIGRTGIHDLETGGDRTIPIGVINGIEFTAYFQAENKLDRDEKGAMTLNTHVSVWKVDGETNMGGADVTVPVGNPTTAEGVVRSVPEIPKSIESMISADERMKLATANELAEIANLLNRSFAGVDELTAAQQRYTDLQNEVINGTSEQSQKAAELLFDTGIDRAPLLIRLRTAVNNLTMEYDQLAVTAGRADARQALLDPGPNQDAAIAERDSSREKMLEIRPRLTELTKRLQVVERVRLEAEMTGDASGMHMGLTPSHRPGIAYDTEFAPPSLGEEMLAQGIPQLRSMLSRPDNGLTAEARRVALELLNEPVMSKLDWSQLAVALVNEIEGGFAGGASISDWLIHISKQARSTTLPHEVFHFLYAMMPEEDRIRIEDYRKQAVMERYGDTPPPEMLAGTMTSMESVAAGVDPSDYHLINASEFLAHFASERYARDSFRRRNDPIKQSLWDRIRLWIRGLIDSIKRALGIRPDMEQIVRDILAGKNVTNMRNGVEAEGEVRGQRSTEPEPPESSGVSLTDLEAETARAEAEAIAEGWIKTEVLGRQDKVRGREMLTEKERAAGAKYAADIFKQAGLDVVLDDNTGLWRLADPGMESEVEGRKLLDILKSEIAVQKQPGTVTGYLGNLLNSVVVNMTQDANTAFSPQLRRDLYAVAQGERSHRGLLLGALAGFGKTVDYVARNVDVVLARVHADAFGGDTVREIMDRVLTEFRDEFTDEEIDKALEDETATVDLVNKIIALNRQDEGGRVYRKAQALLKPKARKKLAQLEADARVNEAVTAILEQLKAEGIEPQPSPNKPLPPLERLLHMVHPKTVEKINKAIEQAIIDAERNAGMKVALKEAESDEEREDLMARFAAGEEPTKEQVESGLATPEYSHWQALRDNLLDYSPVTLKLAQRVIQGDFRGIRLRDPKAKPVDTRIDITALAEKPDAEVDRVLAGYLQNLDAAMDMRSATDESRQRILSMVEAELTAQLEAARARIREPIFAAPVKAGTRPTPEQRIFQLLNAGLFKDPRLNLREMVERVASKTPLQRLVPKLPELIKAALQTPFYRQDELVKAFADSLVSRLGVAPDQAQKAAEVFAAAFSQKFAKARGKALKKAAESLTPSQRKAFPPNKPVWKKIEEAVNAGVFDNGAVLRSIAADNGWWIPDDKTIARIKELAAEMQRIKELTRVEREQIGDNPLDLTRAQADKEAATLEKRVAIKKQIETLWARMTRPITLRSTEGRKNLVEAIGEFESANLLFKASFAPKQLIDVLTQGGLHTPTRAVAAAVERWQTARAADRDTALWREVGSALRDAYKQRLDATRAALSATLEAFKGTGEARNVDRLMTRIAVFERAAQKADELDAHGKHVQATLLRAFEWVRFGYRVAQALDNLHGLPAEYQEMRQLVITSLRENGMTKLEAETKADGVMGDMKAEWMLAIARVQQLSDLNNWNYTANEVRAAAWLVVKSRQYQRMREIGLPADDFVEHNRLLRNTVGWNERETGGLGGAVAGGIRHLGQFAKELPFPLGLPFVAMTRFGNAIGTAINRKLSFTPLGFFPSAFGDSPWYRTEEDRRQRKVEAAIGTPLLAMFFLLALTGAVRVWLRPPKDKDERELWEKEGHRAGTVEIPLADGTFIPISLSTGPLALFAEAFAAGGALNDLNRRQDEKQTRLNAEAAAHGVMPGTVDPLSMSDYLGVGWDAFYATILGGRTASGLLNTISDYGVPNPQKFVASTVSPLIPGLPAAQEASRMAGVRLDPKLATVFDFMLPLPTSQAVQINALGDPVGNDDALQRIGQILTGGTFFPVDPGDARQALGYQALFASGYRPPAIASEKGYVINGEFRPMTGDELKQYAELRGQFFKEELGALGYTDDKHAVQQAYQRANARALGAVGAAPAPSTSASRSRPGLASVSGPQAARPLPRRGSSVRRRGPRARGSYSRSPTMRRGRSLKDRLRGTTRSRRTGSLRRRRRV